MVTGASGAGKTAVCQTLAPRSEAAVVLEMDILLGHVRAEPEDVYRSYKSTWLRVAMNVGQAGRPVVLCGTVEPGVLGGGRADPPSVGQLRAARRTAQRDAEVGATPSGGVSPRSIFVPVSACSRSVDDRQPGRCGQPRVTRCSWRSVSATRRQSAAVWGGPPAR